MTRTYQLDGLGAADSNETDGIGWNEEAPVVRTDSVAVERSIPSLATDEISGTWTTQTNEPNSADWPNGTYNGSVNCTVNQADASFKMQLLRSTDASPPVTQETLGTGASESGTGVKTVAFTLNPTAGVASNLYQLFILGSNTNSHGTRRIRFLPDDTRSEINGPWPSAQDDGIVSLRRYQHMPVPNTLVRM